MAVATECGLPGVRIGAVERDIIALAAVCQRAGIGPTAAVPKLLAKAGLNRLGMADIVSSVIEPEEMLPAVAQGAIGIERRAADARAAALLDAIRQFQDFAP